MKENFNNETTHQEIQAEDTVKPSEKLTDQEKFNQRYKELSVRDKNALNEKYADVDAYNKWKEDHPEGTKYDYAIKLMDEVSSEKPKQIKEAETTSSDGPANSDIAGEAREVPVCGLSCLMTKEAYDKAVNGEYGNYGETQGRSDGVFVAPSDQIQDLLDKSDGDLDKICESLGVKKDDWQTESLVKINIPKEEADKLHPRYPSGYEEGADKELWSGGGKTVSEDGTKIGCDEFVIDQIDINETDYYTENIFLERK